MTKSVQQFFFHLLLLLPSDLSPLLLLLLNHLLVLLESSHAFLSFFAFLQLLYLCEGGCTGSRRYTVP